MSIAPAATAVAETVDAAASAAASASARIAEEMTGVGGALTMSIIAFSVVFFGAGRAERRHLRHQVHGAGAGTEEERTARRKRSRKRSGNGARRSRHRGADRSRRSPLGGPRRRGGRRGNQRAHHRSDGCRRQPRPSRPSCRMEKRRARRRNPEPLPGLEIASQPRPRLEKRSGDKKAKKQ